VPSNPDDPITFTCALEARHETVYFLAKLIHEHCERTGTRRGTRALGPFRHAVMVLRWFLDGTRIRQLAADNHIGKTTCYDRLHEAIDLLAALAPDVQEAIFTASAAGATHLNLDGTLIHTDGVTMKGPNDADLWWSGKHRRHGGNVKVLADPAGFPIWVSGVRPGREHDTTCAKAAPGLLAALAVCESEYQMPTLTDLGYLNVSPAIRHPFKKPKGGELTEAQTTYNTLIRGVHGVAERANALFKETFATLQLVSLSPTRIGAIAKAALVLLHLEHDRPLPGGYAKLRLVTRKSSLAAFGDPRVAAAPIAARLGVRSRGGGWHLGSCHSRLWQYGADVGSADWGTARGTASLPHRPDHRVGRRGGTRRPGGAHRPRIWHGRGVGSADRGAA